MFYNYSEIFDDTLSQDNPLYWSRPTPLDCGTIRIIGIFLCTSSFLGITLNGSLLYSFVRYRALRTPSNIFIMFISIMGLLGSFGILPLTGLSSIYCSWLFNRGGCQLEGVMAFLYGCSSSYLLCAVSLTRCYIIIRPFNAKDITVTKCVIFATIAVFISFVWTILPVIGWNEYTLEGARTSCCINWYSRRPSFMSYNFCLFICVYLIPLFILLITNTIIYFGLKRMRNKIKLGGKSDLSQKKIEMERRILKSIIITVCGFVLTWTPYAIVFFTSVFRGKDDGVDPLATFICACFAKSSVIWIPLLYISTSTHFKFHFVDFHSINKQNQTTINHPPLQNSSVINENYIPKTQIPAINPISDKQFTSI